jgi:energy-coupling factor transporter ATP-binding protein EcfA2
MVVNKLPKISALAGFSVGGWLLPLALNLPLPLEGFSLALACFSSVSLAVETKRETIVSGIAHQERRMGLERIAYEMTLQHERELAQLRSFYGFGDDSDSDDDDYGYAPSQAQIEGATIDQRTIAPGSGEAPGGGESKLWHIDRLLQNNSSHVLVIGQSGAGKTTLARWLLAQLKADKTIILDADDDGRTWEPYPTIGAGDDWVSIEGAMMEGLEDFKNRKPNDPALPMTVFILEEMPDLVVECQSGVNFCSRILRRGRKRKMFVIGLTQDPNSGSGIGLSQPVQKCFSRIFLGGMAQYALSNLVPRGDRPHVAIALKSCNRPSIVEFLGEWYAWAVPDLSSTAGNQTPKPSTQTIAAEEGTIAILNRTLQAPVATKLHWDVVDFAISRGDWISVRDTQRGVSGIKTAEECKQLFQDLIGLELGETRHDAKHDRVLFRAYQ